MMRRVAALCCLAALGLSACSGSDGDDAEISCESDLELQIANLLPATGRLSFLGPAQFAAAALAVEQVNEAGGVLGKPVGSFDLDSGDESTSIATTRVDEAIQRGADVVVGATSSAVSLQIIDRVIDAGLLQISPANTAIEFSDYPDDGLYWRTAPPDTLQASVLADVVAADGVAKPAVLAQQGAYGEDLAATFETEFVARGRALALPPITYDPALESFETVVAGAANAGADGVVLIGGGESAKVVAELIKQGIGPADARLFLVDANMSQSLYLDLPEGVMAGTKGTLPGAAASDEFREQLLAVDPALVDLTYAPETYDAVTLVALAAAAAGSDCGADIAEELVAVSSIGEPCTSYAECIELQDAGTDIDYQGQSGPVSFAENGDPTEAIMGVYVYGGDNRFTAAEQINARVPAPAATAPPAEGTG